MNPYLMSAPGFGRYFKQAIVGIFFEHFIFSDCVFFFELMLAVNSGGLSGSQFAQRRFYDTFFVFKLAVDQGDICFLIFLS